MSEQKYEPGNFATWFGGGQPMNVVVTSDGGFGGFTVANNVGDGKVTFNGVQAADYESPEFKADAGKALRTGIIALLETGYRDRENGYEELRARVLSELQNAVFYLPIRPSAVIA